MNEEKKPQEFIDGEDELEEITIEIADDMDEDMDIDDFVPTMNVNGESGGQVECIVGDETLLTLYEEILNNSRKDREQTDEILADFINMVMNDGESSSASKEAIVNLMKIKSDSADKMTKIADLMTRLKLKERDTFPRYLAAQQNNKIVFDGSKRDFLKQIENKVKKQNLGNP